MTGFYSALAGWIMVRHMWATGEPCSCAEPMALGHRVHEHVSGEDGPRHDDGIMTLHRLQLEPAKALHGGSQDG